MNGTMPNFIVRFLELNLYSPTLTGFHFCKSCIWIQLKISTTIYQQGFSRNLHAVLQKTLEWNCRQVRLILAGLLLAIPFGMTYRILSLVLTITQTILEMQ
jgi:hypothetical protein